MSGRKFEMLSVEEMRARYGLVARNSPTIRLDPRNVPEDLRHLIPYAELWGVGDDLIREDIVRSSPKEAIDELRRIIEDHEVLLDEWLAGAEADSTNPTDEYLAFSAMRMASDFA